MSREILQIFTFFKKIVTCQSHCRGRKLLIFIRYGQLLNTKLGVATETGLPGNLAHGMGKG
jgi:hypothetical protein